jgi:hypothetical protein
MSVIFKEGNSNTCMFFLLKRSTFLENGPYMGDTMLFSLLKGVSFFGKSLRGWEKITLVPYIGRLSLSLFPTKVGHFEILVQA